MHLTLISDGETCAEAVACALACSERVVRRASPDILPSLGREGVIVLLSGPAARVSRLAKLVEGRHSVLVLCPEGGAPAVSEALEAGALDALPWPCAEVELEARVKRALHLHAKLAQLEEQNRVLERLSATDGLTGISNRRHFESRLDEEFRRAFRYDDALSLVLLDIDHFKGINDAHGHLTGDTVLAAVARAIQDAVRDTDLVARYGGEEFAVLLPRTHLAGALSVAERIRAAICEVRPLPQLALSVTASFGVAAHPSARVAHPRELIDAADTALYRAKREGRDRICLHGTVPAGPPAHRVVGHPG